MSILNNVKALVEPLVFKKDGSVSCGFGVRIQMSVILDRENWIKIEDGIKTIEAELASLRAANAELVDAVKNRLTTPRGGACGIQGCARPMNECACFLDEQADARLHAALSRAEQAGKAEGDRQNTTCCWRSSEQSAVATTQCGQLGDITNLNFIFCPFCGRYIEVKK